MSPTVPHSPQVGRKCNHGKKKEGARDLKPQNAAHPAERTKKTAHALGDSTAGLREYLPGILNGAVHLNRCISNGLRLRGGICLRGFHKSLANHAACNSNPNA